MTRCSWTRIIFYASLPEDLHAVANSGYDPSQQRGGVQAVFSDWREDLRQLLEGRKSLVAPDNGLTMKKSTPASNQHLKFIK